ncbi:MAG TPA: glycosyltransferase [Phycisphaerae bacterium]|nr:glycosyltransferase [Phycisphaerae bacterium]HRY68342.1 glycosyltransferase [Phycisphaerae bacterium]HSA26775.1 glycosyltransferase [Phycisphaerae bacterium]
MHVILIPLGSVGDIHPFLWLGRGLKARGHRVTLISNAYFESMSRGAGLDFEALGPIELYHEIVENPDGRDPKKSGSLFREKVLPWLIRPMYEMVARHHVPGETVVVANAGAFGARIAQDHLGIPLATICLQPQAFRSIHETPRHPDWPILSYLPRRWKKMVFAFVDRFCIDPLLGPPINAFRVELGLPAVRHHLGQWLFSPQRIIGLFPPWLGRPQPDWPRQTRLTGFPLYDAAEDQPLPAGLAEFLDAGPPPVAFTMGSPFRDQDRFFQASVDACRQLGRRGLLVTRHKEQVPAGLPDGILHVEYAPYGRVFPRVALVVHHGGMGTLSQALLAGVPHLIMPIAYDQPDNADRLTRLGVALPIKRALYTAHTAAAAIRKLTESRDVAARCREVAAEVRSAHPLNDTCLLVEQLRSPAVAR